MIFRFLLVVVFFVFLPTDASQNKIVRGPYLQNPSQNNILLRYRTKNLSPTLLKYWKQNSPEQILIYQDMVLTNNHQVLLTNLDSNSSYEYQIESQNKSKVENISVSDMDYKFKTQSTHDEALVWVIGDPGIAGFENFRKKYKHNQKNVLNKFLDYQQVNKLRDPDALLSLGDNTYFYGFDEEYQKGFFDEYNFLLSKIPLYTVFGNHDAGINKQYLTYSSRSYPSPRGVFFDIFNSPNNKPYYSFNLGCAHFIILDSFDSLWEDLKPDQSNFQRVWTSNSQYPNSMIDWLNEDLSKNKSKWTIVAFHHPPYGTDDEGSNRAELWRAWMNSYIVPIIEKYKVDLVLCGHIHNYQRSYPIKSVIETSSSEVLDNKSFSNKKNKASYKAFIHQLLIDSKLSSYNPVVKSIELKNYIKDTGTIYNILGSSGAAFNPIEDNPFGMFAVQSQIEGSALLSISSQKLNWKFITIKGDIIDDFTIEAK
jgi:acid phosphatase type 7